LVAAFVLLLRDFFVFLVVFFVTLEQRLTKPPTSAAAVQRPVRRAWEQPGEYNHVARNALQTKHAGAARREIVEVRNHSHFDAGLEEQRSNQILLKLPLVRIGALPLRYDNGDSTSHRKRLAF